MKLKTLKILTCPNCSHSSLQIKVLQQNKDEIITGELTCPICSKKYPIKEGIPRMMSSLKSSDKHEKIKKANIEYHDLAANTYEKDIEEATHQNQFNQKRIENIIKKLSQKTNNKYFLDVGCGTGNLLKFGQKYFKNVIGIDVSINMIRIAKKRGYEVIQADALKLPFKNNTFNTISIFSVLHHIYNYNLFFKEASRTLKAKGYLYTDWDPTKKPVINKNKVSWKILQLIKFFIKILKKTLRIFRKPKGINLRKINPELKKIYEVAEYHNLALKGKERGVDFRKMKKSLIKNNFDKITPIFHSQGRSLSQLSLSLKIKFFFLKFQRGPLKYFMENIMIIAQKR